MELDGLIEPDVIITKNPPREPEFDVEPLFHDIVYPVCSPAFHERHFHGRSLKPLDLLSRPTLKPAGRPAREPVPYFLLVGWMLFAVAMSIAAVARYGEHVDWRKPGRYHRA
ncbi:transcriptional regulator, LysR family [Burkholderia ambifaria IOP40-10]|uniref:Transcriptional regulator, LysR family n=1 Tax=Burkholderia ambifaria IOP40-10 TaxID=396596 RepID=B1FD46_9BURK|nr:transcriptional regulator, LysR family [Burkholderia ambifaria IOP40-10]